MKRVLSAFILTIIAGSNLLGQAFIGSFDMVTTHNFPNGSQRIDTISYFFGEDKTALIIYGKRKDPDMRMVFNPKELSITNLFEMNGKKSGYILPMDDKHWPGMKYALRPYDSGPRKELNYTGKTAKLNGYLCKEVLAEQDEYSARMMVAENLNLSLTTVFSYQSVGAGKKEDESRLFDKFGVQNLPMEIFLKSKKEKANVEIRLVNFNVEVPDSIFSTEGFSVSKIE